MLTCASCSGEIGSDAAVCPHCGATVDLSAAPTLRYVEHDASPRRWESLATGRPAAVRFWYRQSPEPLEAAEGFGRVSRADPPLDLPGMASVVLDTQGRLLELRVVPPARVEDAGAQPPESQALISAAGLDPSTLAPAGASFTPPVFADARAAWGGRFPEAPAYPLRVEAAALVGRPVFFRVLGPWQDSQRPAGDRQRSGLAAFRYRFNAISFVVLGGGVLLAWRNVRLGRGDRAGARRLAPLRPGPEPRGLAALGAPQPRSRPRMGALQEWPRVGRLRRRPSVASSISPSSRRSGAASRAA